MSEMVIFGGKRLEGEVRISGAKNAALPILFATILIEKQTVFLENIPNIRDVRQAISILESIGVRVTRQQAACIVSSDEINAEATDTNAIAQIRASSYLMGALLGRCGSVTMPLPGGCDFGKRPIDLHLYAFEKMGASHSYEDERLILKAEKLHGAKIEFPIVSVGATVNAVLAAVSADGDTLITNAARETHVCDLCRFLNACGASISGIGTSVLSIHGGLPLHGCHYRIIDDAIEMGTYLAAGVATRGCVTACGHFFSSVEAILAPLYKMGVRVFEEPEKITVDASAPLFATKIKTAPFPGFPTDLHPLFAVLLTQGRGDGFLTETVWQERFRYLEELQKMGASAVRQGDAVRTRYSKLTGADVLSVDLRAGAALVVAGLAADGITVVKNAELISRGYENISKKLCALGAKIDKRQ